MTRAGTPPRPEVKKHKLKAQAKTKLKAQDKLSSAPRKGRRIRRKAPVFIARKPSDRALRAAAVLSDRVGQRAAKVRFSFVRRDDGAAPPLARLLRGGRGGEVRLKLLLSLLWTAGGGDERHMTSPYPARSWAALLDLPDPEKNGQRRIRDAVEWLEREGFVAVDRYPGKPMALQLRLENGSGHAYFDPAKYAKEKKASKKSVESEDLFITLPASFWTEGWAAILSARAIAMLLVLAELTFEKDWKWASPSIARAKYGLSEDTWSKGVAELKAHKLIEVRKQSVGEDFDFRRVRNSFKLPREKERRLVLPARPAAT